MNKGDYVRTKNNKICKIINKKFDDTLLIDLYEIDTNGYLMEIDILKSSPNIIDLIEVGDYVNGEQVFTIEKVHNKNYALGVYENYLYEDDIKLIVTKEQFSAMEYKVESEVE